MVTATKTGCSIGSQDATGWPRGVSRSQLQKQAEPSVRKMPQAGPVVFHVHSYKNRLSHRFARCHGLAPWCFTLPSATSMKREHSTARARGITKNLGAPLLATNVSDHGARPWPQFCSDYGAGLARSWAMSTRRRIFPDADLGILSMNSTKRSFL